MTAAARRDRLWLISRVRRPRSAPVELGFDLAVDIDCPSPVVFALLSDIQDYEPIPKAERIEMTKHPAAATRLGTWWDEHVRLAPGVWLTVQSVVTELDVPATLGMTFHGRWFEGHLTYTVEPCNDQTTLHQRETIRLRWPLSWFSARVERTLRRQLGTRLIEIKALAESHPQIRPGL